VPADLHSSASGRIKLIKNAPGFVDVSALAFETQPAIPGSDFDLQLFFERLQQFEIVGVQILYCATVLKL
jgi:hypothetical protein